MKNFYKGMSLVLSTAILISPLSTFALSKDETVFSTAGATGKVNKTIVSEHLVNDEKSDTISDFTNLKDIKNINGDELFTINSKTVTWDSKGNDIYYQGTSSEQLPITAKVTYSLNGKEMSRKKMIGKSGHVVINIKYTNNVKVGDLYTPFVVATETMIDTKNNSNVTVTSGKVISTGTKNVIAAISSPGLSESLNMSELKELDEVTIEYDTKKFSKNNIYSVATSKLLDNSDLDKLNDVDKLYSEVNTLSDASNQIVDGSKSLVNGTASLVDGTIKVTDGINNIYNGASTIKELVSKSVNSLSSDLSEDEKNTIINNAVETINNTFTDEYKASIAADALETLKTNAEYQTLRAGKAQLEATGIQTIYPVCSGDVIPEQYKTACGEKVNYIAKYATVVTGIKAMEDTAQATAISTAYQTAIKTASETAIKTATIVKTQAVSTTKDSLLSLENGLTTLTNGISTLKNGSNSLLDGTKTLNEGANKLYNGANQFNETGIKKIANLVNGKLKTTTTKVKQLVKLSNNYDTFTLKDNEVDGNTKFITVIK